MSGEKNCSRCGKPLTAAEPQEVCPHCGETVADALPDGWIGCPMCGTQQAMTAAHCTHCGEDLAVRQEAAQQQQAERLGRDRQVAGLFWTILGLVSVAVLIQVLNRPQPLRPHPAVNTDVGVLTLGLLAISGGGFLFFGGLILAGKSWAIHGGLWLSYVCLAGALMDFNVPAVILYLLGVLVGHKVLRNADKLGMARRRVDQTTPIQ